MLAGRMDALDVEVFRAESVDDLWGNHPLVFRLAMLPRILQRVFEVTRSRHPFAFVVLGTPGERLDVLNEAELSAATDGPEMNGVGYAAENIVWGNTGDSEWSKTMMVGMLLLQTVVWCLQGEDVELVSLGEHGGTVAAWEIEQEGPKIEGIRALALEDQPQASNE